MAVVINVSKEKFLPCYHHLLDDTEFFDIDFLWGGRDSGKSRHTAQQLVIECLRSKYFKYLLVRKVLATVRDSQYSLIKSVIDEWGLGSLFSFNETRMEIVCKMNGNGFYGRGLDDMGKIKSFNNPSGAWIEEGNQITNDDFTVLMSSIRANGVRTKVWFTFNPECDVNYTDFWLWQEYFSHTTELSWTWEKKVYVDGEPISTKIRSTHTTYRDNKYCPKQRAAIYEGYKISKNNAYWYQTYTLGLWGYREAGQRFLHCFDRSVHVREFDVDVSRMVCITVDNNVDPYIAVQLWQYQNVNGERFIRQFDELAASAPINTATKAAKAAAAKLRQYGVTVPIYTLGDATTQKRSTEDDEGRSFYMKFISVLKEEGFQVVDRIGKVNPGVVASGDFINDILESNYDRITIEVHPRCVRSIEDYYMTKRDADGTILKKSIKDKDSGVSYQQWGHFTDNARYVVVSVVPDSFDKHKARHRKQGIKIIAR